MVGATITAVVLLLLAATVVSLLSVQQAKAAAVRRQNCISSPNGKGTACSGSGASLSISRSADPPAAIRLGVHRALSTGAGSCSDSTCSGHAVREEQSPPPSPSPPPE